MERAMPFGSYSAYEANFMDDRILPTPAALGLGPGRVSRYLVNRCRFERLSRAVASRRFVFLETPPRPLGCKTTPGRHRSRDATQVSQARPNREGGRHKQKRRGAP